MPSQKQTDGQYHLVSYASWSVTIYECNYHSTEQEILGLKWAIVEQFQEYLLWKLFTVRNDNPLTYIMTNLDATQHWWEESLTRFTFSIEYQKGQDNAAADALSQVTLKLDSGTMKSIQDGVTEGMTERADAQDPVVAKADKEIHKQVQGTAILAQAACINLHVIDWVTTQQGDPALRQWWSWINPQMWWTFWSFCNHFMKHIMVYVTPNQTVKTVVKFLWQGYILIFGGLAKLLSDWGAHFESNIIRELCELTDMQKVRASPYHAQTIWTGRMRSPNADVHDKEIE